MFDLVSESHKEIEVSSLGRVSVTEVLAKTLREVPVFWFSINLDVTDSPTGTPCPPKPWSAAPTKEHCVEKCGPRHDDEDNVLGSPKPRSGSIVGIHCRNGRGAALLDVIPNRLR